MNDAGGRAPWGETEMYATHRIDGLPLNSSGLGCCGTRSAKLGHHEVLVAGGYVAEDECDKVVAMSESPGNREEMIGFW